MDDLKAEKRKKYRIVETNAGKIAVQFRMDDIAHDMGMYFWTFRLVEKWHLYDERFESVKEANHFIDGKVERDLDSEFKKVIE